MTLAGQKKNWNFSSNAFESLLRWLDAGEDSDGFRYLEMRQRLATYFDRKNCLMPDEMADETLNRVARRLEEEGSIDTETPAKYCYIVARYVFLEYLRGMDKASVSLDYDLAHRQDHLAAPDTDEEDRLKEKRLTCLEKCMGDLDMANRDLIVNYYYGVQRVKIENRRHLAKKLDISINALGIRACRIRDKLETCVGKCIDKAGN